MEGGDSVVGTDLLHDADRGVEDNHCADDQGVRHVVEHCRQRAGGEQQQDHRIPQLAPHTAVQAPWRRLGWPVGAGLDESTRGLRRVEAPLDLLCAGHASSVPAVRRTP